MKQKYGAGRTLAAPQIGQKRLIYIDYSVAMILPTLELPDDETMEVLDDCMSFPPPPSQGFRYKRCVIYYIDLEKTPVKWNLKMTYQNYCSMNMTIRMEFGQYSEVLMKNPSFDENSFQIGQFCSLSFVLKFIFKLFF